MLFRSIPLFITRGFRFPLAAYRAAEIPAGPAPMITIFSILSPAFLLFYNITPERKCPECFLFLEKPQIFYVFIFTIMLYLSYDVLVRLNARETRVHDSELISADTIFIKFI